MGAIGNRPPKPLDCLTNIDKELLREGRELAAQMREEMWQHELERQRIAAQERRKKRKSFTKKERMAVYEKYGGHCAYCGCEIDYKDMQVDHAVPVNGGPQSDLMLREGTMNNTDNLMPACRQCNFYKEASDIENFRWKIREVLQHSCINTFQARLGMKYGIITFNGWDGKFFFETFNKQ